MCLLDPCRRNGTTDCRCNWFSYVVETYHVDNVIKTEQLSSQMHVASFRR